MVIWIAGTTPVIVNLLEVKFGMSVMTVLSVNLRHLLEPHLLIYFYISQIMIMQSNLFVYKCYFAIYRLSDWLARDWPSSSDFFWCRADCIGKPTFDQTVVLKVSRKACWCLRQIPLLPAPLLFPYSPKSFLLDAFVGVALSVNYGSDEANPKVGLTLSKRAYSAVYFGILGILSGRRLCFWLPAVGWLIFWVAWAWEIILACILVYIREK